MTSPQAWPTARREGFWRSPGYRPGRRRAQATQTALALTMFVLVVALALHVVEAGIGATMFNGGRETEQDVRSLVANVNVAAGWFVILAAATALCFIAWLSRSIDNAPPLAAGTPERGPRESIAWWLVPGANLVVPAMIVGDLYGRLGADRRSGRDAIVVAWWVATACGIALAILAIGMRPDLQPDIASAAQGQGVAGTAADLVCLVAAALGLWLVAEIQGRADLRAAMLGLGGLAQVGPPPATQARPVSMESFVWPDRGPGGSAGPAPVPAVTTRTEAGIPPAPGEGDGHGTPVAVTFCPRCGRRRSAAGRFCVGCGQDLGSL